MTHRRRFFTAVLVVLALAGTGLHSQAPRQTAGPQTDEQKILEAMHLIQSQPLYDYVKELVSEKYGGRLTGTPEYDACAAWVASLLKCWGVQPAATTGPTSRPSPIPTRWSSRAGSCAMNIPGQGRTSSRKSYTVRGRVHPRRHVRLGRGDGRSRLCRLRHHRPRAGLRRLPGRRRQGQDRPDGPRSARSAGRADARALQEMAALFLPPIQARERRRPRGQGDDLQLWADRQSQQLLPARASSTTMSGRPWSADVFAGTGRTYAETVAAIRKELKPQSFATGKIMTLKNVAEHHPEGIGINVVGVIPGTRSRAQGRGHHHRRPPRPPRPAVGADARGERQRHGRGRRAWAWPRPWPSARSSPSGRSCSFSSAARSRRVAGSRLLLCEHPDLSPGQDPGLHQHGRPGRRATRSPLRGPGPIPRSGRSSRRPTRNTSTGCCPAARPSYPGRPRQDSAWFFWKGVPSLTFGAYGKSVPYPTYHNTGTASSWSRPRSWRTWPSSSSWP